MSLKVIRPGILLLSSLAWCFFANCYAADPQPAPTTNVLILLADDWQPDAIGALGHPVVKTPVLDQLVKRGQVLHNMYCLGSNSGAVCRPSRNMLLSGKAYFRWSGPDAPATGDNLPATFKTAGYETWHCGKRGNTAVPIQTLFEHNHYINENQARASGKPGEEVTEQALSFLKNRDTKRPFLMYCAFETPHDPRVPTTADRDYYAQQTIPLPKNFLPQHPFDNGEMSVRDEKLIPWPRTEAALRKELQDYYGVMTGLDRQIGRLLEQLQAQGVLERTIVVFTSDHGLAMGGHGLLGKQNLYEHSMRSPCIVAGPGIKPGENRDLYYLLDIYPTLCGLVNIPEPKGLDGENYAAIWRGEKQPGRSTIMTSYRNVQRAVRDDKFKLIRYPLVNRNQLFNLSNDPAELHDLSNLPEHQATLKRLQAELSNWQQRLGDETPLHVQSPASGEWSPPKQPANAKAKKVAS